MSRGAQGVEWGGGGERGRGGGEGGGEEVVEEEVIEEGGRNEGTRFFFLCDLAFFLVPSLAGSGLAAKAASGRPA